MVEILKQEGSCAGTACVTIDKDGRDINKTDDSNDNNDNKKISINTATKEELLTLPDIGDSKANAIIEYRKKSKFKSIEDIKKVSGIGDKLYDKIKDFITT